MAVTEKQLNKCPNCGHSPLSQSSMTDRFDFTTESGETVSVEATGVPIEVCPNCKETYLGPAAAKVEHGAVCQALGLLSPAEIRALRENLGMTQSELAKVTGIGEATISRWERGRLLQNKAMDRLMRLLGHNDDNLQFLRRLGSRSRLGVRPFPWRCATCGKDEVYLATISYTAKISHDGRRHEFEIPDLRVAKCQSCGELLFSVSADEQVEAALRAHLRLLAPEQIREQRKALGLSQKDVAERTGIAEATISRWESGAMIQSRAMDNFLRVFFAVPQARDALARPNCVAQDFTEAQQNPPATAARHRFKHLIEKHPNRLSIPLDVQRSMAGIN